MAEKKRRNWILLGAAAFVVYLFTASSPIGSEMVLEPAWLRLTATADNSKTEGELVPFRTSRHFGYFDAAGHLSIVREMSGRFALSDFAWTEYPAVPASLDIRSPTDEALMHSEERGYPFFADGRVFVVGSEQNSIAALDSAGATIWRRDFAAPMTCADAAAGLLLIGLLDGSVELLSEAGELVFAFEPGGSRLPVIVAAKLSQDGRRIALISGIEPQRFLLLERSGTSYKVAYHEFLERGFRRAVKAAFVDGERRVAFEREGALGVYDIGSRKSWATPLGGDIVAMEESGADGRLFLILIAGNRKELVALRLPDTIYMRAPYRSGASFITRRENRLYLGGDDSIAAFDIATR
jgi:hypothetical protein